MTESTATYALSRTLDLSFEEADRQVRDALQEEGFGVLTEIDVKATLKKKLDVDFPQYEILGACNPPLAHQALQAEADIGLLLPCNVVVRALDDGRTMVEAIDPVKQLSVADNPELPALAEEVRQRMERVIAAVG
ncbi:MAG: DUF302 domain-containing protein [Gemmatimonadetes bacterium]|nr:DUF302 domain-containing protein [Gemmatimonadota bacterium]NIQ55231.1 DUF302 domain-containing protein [Gemmatimonadota bacterium]NIU75435.1 DUF302 domain-containing protein [Gammaproteobacteria bacterium]NIX45179.1 DUF302 domain-containing protein [Gemmatimonadota bacterium]NIY09422.1 DUF302 domain-containing protein [Gemmatimonadota bacterium]